MKRAKIVLMAAQGEPNKTIAELLGIDPRQVSRWRRRFVHKRLEGIEKDLPRGGRKATKREQMAPMIIERTTQAKPSHATHWSVRTLAESLGIDKSMVQRVWHASGLKPHLAKTFKVSRDKKFVEKSMMLLAWFPNLPKQPWFRWPKKKHRFKPLTGPNPDWPRVRERLEPLTTNYNANGTTTL